MTSHTYIAGEDAGRLASAARDLGLHREEARRPKVTWKDILFDDNTLTAARMHSVGYVAQDERVDEYGHLISVRKRKQVEDGKKQQYAQLTDLFTKIGKEPSYQKVSEEPEDRLVAKGQVLEEEIVEGGSLGAAAFGIIKGTVGPAVLYLSKGFYQSGYAAAIPAMIFATGMYIFNAYRLLDCWRVESERNEKIDNRLKEVQSLLMQSQETSNAEQYGATAVEQERFFTTKLLTYPELAKRALGSYSAIVECGIAFFQFGVCLTYLIFVPENLYQCAYAIFGVHIPKTYLLIIMIAIEVPLSWIRDIRKLTPTNVLASFLVALGLLCILIIAIHQGSSIDPVNEEIIFVENLRTMKPITDAWFLFIGTSFFMMEGSITLVIPLQEAVFRPEDRRQFPDMNRNVASWICLFYIVFSGVCCAAFGKHIQTALTASLRGSLATVVQLAYSVAVILTFPLQAFPAMEVAIRMLNKYIPSNNRLVDASEGWRRNVFATVITLLLGVIAVCAIDYLGNVVSILGSLFGIPLALVFPPLMHNSLVKSAKSTRWVNYVVVVIGIFAMGAASFNTITTWDKQSEG